MKRFSPWRSGLRTIPLAIFSALAFLCATGTAALAQHTGGRVGAPPVSHPTVSRPVAPVRSPLVSPGSRGFLIRPPYDGFFRRVDLLLVTLTRAVRFVHAAQSIQSVSCRLLALECLASHFSGLGSDGDWDPGLWLGFDPFWFWNYGCNGSSFYEYGPGYNSPSVEPSYTQPQAEVQNWPIYYGEANPRSCSSI